LTTEEGDAEMVRVESSVLINCPIDRVFEFVTTPENDAQWYIGIESRDHTPGEPAGVGSTSQSIIRFLGVPITVTWEVVEYESPVRIAVKTIEGPVSVEAEYDFEAVGDGQTKVTVCGEADVGGIFKLAEPLVERMAQRQWDASFENLKDVLEG
jgi:carbon monoxide dehydrogenase subunit G